MTEIKISKARYIDLLKTEAALYMLEAGGVDNWSFYSDSLYPTDGEETLDDACDRIDHEVEAELKGSKL